MKFLARPPLEALAQARDRWTPLFFQHGRLEVDDSSVQWLGADGTVYRIPVATLSCILLGPGTTVTHAAICACSDSNTPICWIGDETMRFYTMGQSATNDSENARLQASFAGHRTKSADIARRMFAIRFDDEEIVKGKTIQELRGMEGIRVRQQYAQLGAEFGVPWKARSYDVNCWHLADDINRAISAANAALYSMVTSLIVSLGFLPQLGFIHTSHMLSFTFDIADIFKAETSFTAAFAVVKEKPNPNALEESVLERLKELIEKEKLFTRIPKTIFQLFERNL
ncbi:MAG: type I-E CRISPR-associated endonuclease Cas1e [Puniceicoccales bacterium]|jgi:CRISPR-associated protein Cas1|nr:type I-E CRISPR-associated endonuclease Cas1e [Puniceicoccales bacterium]